MNDDRPILATDFEYPALVVEPDGTKTIIGADLLQPGRYNLTRVLDQLNTPPTNQGGRVQ
jgi:hypothetical protein